MKILLMDLDIDKRRRSFPNLALMKLSAYHKARGDVIFLNFPLCQPDVTYASCVFTWHRSNANGLNAQFGGSGIDIEVKLPDYIEHLKPDYDLYPNPQWSMGYSSRGCPRHCPWCKVPLKEGGIVAWASPKEFYDPRFQLLILLDNNTLAAPNCIGTLQVLTDLPVVVDFNQGLDIRLLNDEHVHYFKHIKTKKLRFAFDSISYETAVRRGIDKLFKAGFAKSHLSFYVLVGFPNDDTSIERIKILQGYGVDVYPMIYKDDTGKEPEVTMQFTETLKFRGARQNLRKFLRVAGRLNK